MVVSDCHNEPSTKRRRCLVGEERKLANEEEQPQQQQQKASTVCTIYIGGLHPRIVEAHLEKMCMPYGSIQRLHLCDRKGYAFCQYATPQQAEAAMQALDGRGLLGRRLMVRPAHSDSHHNHSGAGRAASAPATSNTGNPHKERERLESRIQALKRKLEDSKSSSA